VAKFGVPVWVRPIEGFVVVEADSPRDAGRRVANGEGELVAESINHLGSNDFERVRKGPIRMLPCVVDGETFWFKEAPEEVTTDHDTDLNKWDNDGGVPW
jgi:hypothetical protein